QLEGIPLVEREKRPRGADRLGDAAPVILAEEGQGQVVVEGFERVLHRTSVGAADVSALSEQLPVVPQVRGQGVGFGPADDAVAIRVGRLRRTGYILGE